MITVPGNGTNETQQESQPIPAPAPTPPQQAAEQVKEVVATEPAPTPDPVPVQPKSSVPMPFKDLAGESIAAFENAAKVKIDTSDDSQKQAIAQYSMSDESPDEAAKVYDLSVKMGLPANYIKDNLKEVEKESFNQNFSYDDYKAKSPKFTEWLAKDAQNLPLVKDQMKEYSDFEKNISDYSMMKSAQDALMSGLASFNKSLIEIPAIAYEAVKLPQNIIAELTNTPELSRSGDFLRDSNLSKYYDEAAKFYSEKNPDLKRGILDSVSKGDYSGAGRAIFAQVMTNTPNLMSMIVLGRFGLEKQALGLAGLTSASQAASEAAPDGVSLPVKTTGALSKGALEAAFERTPTLIKGWQDSLLSGIGKQEKTEIIKNFSKMFAESVVQEGSEELMTSMSQDLVDYFTGINPDAIKGIFERGIEAGIVGGAMGGGPTSISGASLAIMQNSAKKRSDTEKSFFLAIGKSAEASKLREKLPKKFQELASQMTKDGPVESFFMDAAAFDKVFEKYEQGGIPGAIKSLGIEQQYNDAKETGGKIAIPTANWATSMNIDVYSKAQDDIAFDSNGMSSNEVKALTEKFMQSQVPQEGQDGQVGAPNLQEMLTKLSNDPAAAALNAGLFNKVLETQSKKSGIPIEKFFNESMLRVSKEGQEQAPAVTADDVLKYPNLNTILNNIREGIEPKQTGKSILQFIRSKGGIKPGGLSADVADLEKGKKGRKLVNNNGLDIDQIALSAVEAGYIQERDINQLVEAIRSEIAGSPVYPIAKEQSDQDIEYQAIKSMISNLGIDLNTVDNATAMKMISENRGSEKETEVFLQSEKITEETFKKPEKDILLKELNDDDLSVIGVGSKPVVIKKNIIKKNFERHPEIQGQNKNTLSEALYGATHIIKSQAKDRPDYYSFIRKIDGSSSYSVIEINDKKSNFEVIGWRKISNKNFDKLIKQTEKSGRDGGQIIITGRNSSQPVVGRLSTATTTDDTLSQTKGKNNNERGFVEITRDELGKSKFFDVKFTKNMDKSTFLHEGAHIFLEVIGNIAEMPESSSEYKQYYADILKYLGVKSRDKIKTKHHEKFAETFEEYLLSGKAPTPELQDMFSTFKSWLVSVYKTIKGIYSDITLDKSVTDLMDRLVATEDEIEFAKGITGSSPMFIDTSGVMNESDSKRMQDLIAKEQQKIEEMVVARAMLDQSKEFKKKQDLRRKEIRAQVEKEVMEEPDQLILRAIRDGIMPDGKELQDGETLKINRKDAKALYDPVQLDRLPRGVLSDDGAHPDLVANVLLGSSARGSDLIAGLVNTPKLKERIDQITDERLAEEFPDPISDGTIAKEAIKAMHDDSALNRKQFEIEVMMASAPKETKGAIKKIAARKITNKQFKERAQYIIGAMKVRDIKPHTFRNAERKAANEAMELFVKGDFNGSIVAKQKEILNGELYKLSIKIDVEVDKDIDNFKKAFRPDEKFAKTYNIDTFNAARSLLSYYGIGKSDKTPDEYLKYVKEYSPDIYNSVIQYLSKAMLNAKDYRDLTYNEFVDLSNSFYQIKEIAKLENEFSTADKKANLRSIIDNELLPELASHMKEKKPGERIDYNSLSFKLTSLKHGLRRVEAWSVGMGDSFKKYIHETVYDGVTKYRISKYNTLNKFKDILSKNSKLFTEESIVAPELPSLDQAAGGHEFKGMKELLGAILHTGNLSNKRKLLIGNQWGEKNEDGSLNSSAWDSFIERMINEGKLTKAHFDLVQEVWDLMESLKPDAQKAHKSMYGYYFEEITSTPFENKFGKYKGGYAPAITDRTRTIDPRDYIVDNLEEAHNWWPSSPNGFTKARDENYAKPLLMDLRLVPNHVDAVLRFSHISVPVKEVSKLLADKTFSKAMHEYDPQLVNEFLMPWLNRTVAQRSNGSTDNKGLDYFFTKMRTYQGAGIMFVNVVNTVQQYTGIFVATSKVGVKYLRNSTFDLIKNGKDVAAFASEKSDFMKTKISQMNDDIVGDTQRIIEPPSKLESVDQWFRKNAYILQSVAQSHVDLVVWSGAYAQAIDEGASDATAIKQADSAVRLTQGTFATEDVSAFEAGSPLMKLFTMFYSYYNTIANLYGTELKVAMNQDMGLRKTAGRLFYLYAMSFAIPAVLAQVMVMAMNGEPFDADDDDEYVTDALKVFFMPQVRTLSGMVPFAGPVISAGIAKFDSNVFNDRISFSPIFQTIENYKDIPYNLIKAYENKEVSKKAVKDALSVLNMTAVIPGVPFIPFQALSRPVGYLMDVKSGNANPDNPIDVARGLITGKEQK